MKHARFLAAALALGLALTAGAPDSAASQPVAGADPAATEADDGEGPAAEPKDPKRRRKGPDLSGVLDLEQIGVTGGALAEVGLDGLDDLLAVHPFIYPDANPMSRAFYFVPRRYRLLHEREDLGVRIHYRRLADDRAEATVFLDLTSGVTSDAKQLAKRLIRHAVREQTGDALSAEPILLLPYPGALSIDLDVATIARTDIEISDTAGLDDRVSLRFTADAETTRVLIDRLREGGLGGRVTIAPDPPPVAPVLVVELERDGVGVVPWPDPSSSWTAVFANPLTVPIRLLHVVYLRDGRKGVESVARPVRGRNGELLAPGASTRLQIAKFGAALRDEKTLLGAWWVFRHASSEDDRNRVLGRLMKGAGEDPSQQHPLAILAAEGLFETYGLSRIIVEVRSPYFDPSAEEPVVNRYVFRPGSDDEIEMDPVMPAGATDELYEYRIVVVDGSGVQTTQPRWERPTLERNILLGDAHLREWLEPADAKEETGAEEFIIESDDPSDDATAAEDALAP